MIKLAVFLGNPGREYANTRHNAAFMLADELFPSTSWQVKFHSAYAKEGTLILLKPMTYMNLSGTAVSECMTFFRIRSEEVIVIHDDLEVPLGEARVQKGGGLKGHNGLKNIKDRIGNDGFWHLRIGISRPKHGDVRNFVTSPFLKEEEIRLRQLFSKVSVQLITSEKEQTISV